MKKFNVHAIIKSFLFFSILVNSVSTYAQIPLPDKWESFINDPKQNILVKDTFRYQSFEGSLQENWKYTEQETKRIHIDKKTIEGQEGEYFLQLNSGSEIKFEPFDTLNYKNPEVSLRIAGQTLPLNTELKIKVKRAPNNVLEMILIKIYKDIQNFTFNNSWKIGNRTQFQPVRVASNPMDLYISASEWTGGGYYCLDNVMAYGDILTYSIFKGKGNWQDSTLWSHYPSARKRKALIKGELEITDRIQCQEINMANTIMKLSSNGQIEVNNLHLFYPEVQIINEGKINIEENLALHIDFPEKGKWYFISFPFDIYDKNIASVFKLKDDQPNSGGNFLYAQFYNGVKRSTTGQAKDNWSIVLPDEKGLIFKKGKGYLIAIDEKANQTLLSLSIPSDNIPDEFGKKDILAVFIDDHIEFSSTQHYGWVLCGNPLPGSLPLQQLKSASIPENTIYIYEDGIYKSYSLNSNYALAPFSTFFIKAVSSTEIPVKSSVPGNNEILLRTFNTLLTKEVEPGAESPTSTGKISESAPNWYIKESTLYLTNMTQAGTVIIRDFSGKIILKQTFQAEQSTISLNLFRGVYLLEIHSGLYRDYDKFIITQ